jgi:flagellum-specific peptidoglycan hydrolase FlgJ
MTKKKTSKEVAPVEVPSVLAAPPLPHVAARAKLFPESVIQSARESERETGIRTCITLAQWALESGYGKHIPPGSFNPFGIKALKGQPFVEVPTKEVYNGKWVTIKAKFRKFPSIAEAFKHHGRLLCSGPYKVAINYRSDWRKFMQRIANIYATDPGYFGKIESIITKYRLDEYNLNLLGMPKPDPDWDVEEYPTDQ